MGATFPTVPSKRIPIPRADSIDSPEAERFVRERQPFVTKIRDWGVLDWHPDYLTKKIGHLAYPLIRTADGERLNMTFGQVLELTRDPYWRKHYMPVSGGGPLLTPQWAGRPLNPDLACLRADYRLPSYLPSSDKVSCEVLFRASGVDTATYFQTPAHWEYDAMSFFSLQVEGRKQVCLFAPDQAPYLGITSELPEFPFLTTGAPACSEPDKYPQVADATCYEVTLGPGDMIYWPAFWFHWFVHHHEYQISFRVKFPQFDHPLNSVSAIWAFSNALATALGGFDVAEERFEALPEETRALLRAIEEAFIADPSLLRTLDLNPRRFSAAVGNRTAQVLRDQFTKNGGKDFFGKPKS